MVVKTSMRGEEASEEVVIGSRGAKEVVPRTIRRVESMDGAIVGRVTGGGPADIMRF